MSRSPTWTAACWRGSSPRRRLPTRETGSEVSSLRDDVSADDVEPLADFEATTPVEDVEGAQAIEDDAGGMVELEPLVDDELEIEAPPPPPSKPFRPGGPKPGAPPPAPPKVAPVVPRRPGRRRRGSVRRALRDRRSRRSCRSGPPRPPAVPPPKRKGAVEVPLLELEPDFESASSQNVDDEPLIDQGTKGFVQTEFVDSGTDAGVSRGRRSGFIDLGVDEAGEGDQPGALSFSEVEAAPLPPSIEQLEGVGGRRPRRPRGASGPR